MLISCNITNFLSFGFKDAKLTMETGKSRGKRNHVIVDKKINLLRFSAFLGANSAGKSNLVKAINFVQSLVIDGIGDDRTITQYYNRTKPENKEKNTEFEFEFKLNSKIYKYSIGIFLKTRKFTYEKLECGDKVIFNRDLENGEFSINLKSKDTDKINKVNMYFDTVKTINNVLFLKDMNLNKGSLYEVKDEINIFNDIYNIFSKSIKIVTPRSRVNDVSVLSTDTLKVEQTLSEFGFDITKLQYKEDTSENIFRGIPQEVIDDLVKQINQKLSEDGNDSEAAMSGPDGLVKIKYENETLKFYTLKCVHGENGEFSLSEESDGLRRVIDLIDIILNPTEGDIYIVDEIDRSLNSILSKAFINYYLNKTEEQNVQLLITTHETRLLDLTMLRKDEIWMFDKYEGTTQITALTDYDGTIRSDVKLDVAYMDGRYGGVPCIKRGEA